MRHCDFSFLSGRTPKIISESLNRKSAVCIPLIETEGGESVLFEKRSESLRSQPGDICFPGGKVEDGEEPAEAAVREMTEELLVSRSQIEMLGPADILTMSHTQVFPYVCFLRDYDGRFNRQEVEEVFSVPLAWFLSAEPDAYDVRWRVELPEDFPLEKIHGGREYGWKERVDRIYFYEYEGRVIWGMTARILYSFSKILREQEKDYGILDRH